ncbi:hypothetical protein DSO57_1031667 [Entomophthora muscae]|uniref:Uncharacterized protein n=1 Tax=Entomophthora muscae TaxID=34485 RepID=A0ACC2SDH9_9FUNG|nr:hypothetical protein DSO57_1031667 [Entomophthora muscae]
MFKFAAPGGSSLARTASVSKLVCISKRWMAKVKATPVALPHRAPQIFTQTVVLTNGATIPLRTTSPKGILILTKDTRNNPLWNPNLVGESDLSSDQIAKFSAKYLGLDDFGLEDEDDAGGNVFDNMEGASASLKITSKDLSFLSTKRGRK